MAMRILLGKRRRIVFVGMMCAALGVGSTLAIQVAQASTAPTPPKVEAHPSPTMHATSPSGLAQPNTTATNAQCGELVKASLTLNGNLFCSGDGLTVSGSSVVLNLNGFQISGGGPSSGTGVRVIGKTETVENGQIVNFQFGVVDTGTTDNVTKLRVSYDYFGIEEYGTGNKLTSNEVFSNQGSGILAFGTSTVLTTNRVTTNDLSGVSYAGLEVGGTKDTLTGNLVTNTRAAPGIYDVAFNSTLTNNVANFNQEDGIAVYDADVIDGGGNLAKGNDISTPTSPTECYNIVCN